MRCAQQQFDVISGGTLVGYQLNRQMAAEKGFGRSNGCAYADSPATLRCNGCPTSASARADGPSTSDLISSVDKGIYIVGDKSWSIDMQRYNFQFTGQRFYKIDKGRLAGQLKDVAYQATTTDFWRAMEAVEAPTPTSWVAPSTAARDSLGRSPRCPTAAHQRCSAR